MPCPDTGEFRHLMMLIPSASARKDPQQSIHLHSRQKLGSEQQMRHAKFCNGFGTSPFPCSRRQSGLPARHRFFNFWQPSSSYRDGGLSRLVVHPRLLVARITSHSSRTLINGYSISEKTIKYEQFKQELRSTDLISDNMLTRKKPISW